MPSSGTLCARTWREYRSRSRRIISKYIWLTKSGQSRQSVSSIAQCAVTGSIQSWSPHPRASHQLSGLAQLTVRGLPAPALTLVSYHIEQSPPTTIITIITIHYRSFTQLPPPHRGSSVSPHYSGRLDNAAEVVARITVAS